MSNRKLDYPLSQVYLSTMIRHLQILFFSLLLIGCADQGSIPVAPDTPTGPPNESHTSLVPAVVGVFFSERTTPAEAEQLVKDLNLTFKFPPSGSPLNAVLSVPIDSEDRWVERLKNYPIVKWAGRIAVTWTS
jgi:hypothetical protein